MEWQILIVGGGTLIAFISVFVKLSFKIGSEFTSLKDAITTLTNSMNALVQSLEKLDHKNEQEHKEIFEQLKGHDHRIAKMENGGKK